jgi:nicotinate phosphoribosyltransferase
MPGQALTTDLYELNMAASYLRHDMIAPATFSLFVRQLPADRGFLVAAGLPHCLEYLQSFAFTDEDLDWLRRYGFDDDAVGAFRRLRFTGDVWAVPEGRIVFANEPILEVTAPIAEAQLVETFLLNQITYQTAVATKAARCRIAAADRFELVDFSLRRTHGVEAGMAAARVSAMVGFTATSNVAAARRYGLRPAGTMAHSYIEAFPFETDAFRTFARDFPGRTTFLVDTYDTVEGVRAAIGVIRELGLRDNVGVRLDSGDLATQAVAVRRMLDDAGLDQVRIFASGGLDEYDLQRFAASRAPVDAAGVGTQMGVSGDAPSLDSAYKLVAYDGRPVLKLSAGKMTMPGAKQVYRGVPKVDEDLVALRDEPPTSGSEPLLVPVMSHGQRLDATDTLAAARERFERDLAAVPAAALDLRATHPPRVRLSPRLLALADELAATRRREPALPSIKR